MLATRKLAVFAVLTFISAEAIAQTPAEIFNEMDSRKRAGISSISNFSKMTSAFGFCTLEHFEKESTESVDGRGTVEYMRLVPLGEISARKHPDAAMSNASPEELDAAAKELRSRAPNIDAQMRNEMSSAGLPGGLGYMITNPPSDKPWLSPMPGDMLGNFAAMMEGAAEGKRQDAAMNRQAEQDAKADPLASAAARTRVVGHETLRDRPAIRLIAEDLNITQQTSGDGGVEQEFIMNTLHLWVDAEHYVPLKMQIEGSAREGNETRDLKIEREDMAYRSVEGCGSMYEPQRSVMRIAGILDAAQQAEMQEAQAQLEEFESQMASMPESQKAMIMRQLGPQMEMFRNMASGGGIEIVSLVTGMRCNAGFPSDKEYMQTIPGISAGACIGFVGSGSGASGSPAGTTGGSGSNGSSSGAGAGGGSTSSGGGVSGGSDSSVHEVDTNLVQIIQRHLATLGYEPGNTDGILDRQTVRAITKFEAAKNMPVTGRPTPQLAGILAAAVDAIN